MLDHAGVRTLLHAGHPALSVQTGQSGTAAMARDQGLAGHVSTARDEDVARHTVTAAADGDRDAGA